MTTYESDMKTVSSSGKVIFNILSDLNNLQRIQDKFPENDAVKEMVFDSDSCSFQAPGIGKISFRIVTREPDSAIVLAMENAPVKANARIDLNQVAENETQLKLTLNADLPPMIKMMADKKLKEGINLLAGKLAETLSEVRS
jgi:carbon monoxide dehydrogenase subunit G